ncbi:hypothetical protein, partial [Albidovulum sp.]|uniref:hypothetical protein n=1 Tax=Albidovulum sp. TaxID=1872424 RepID=UPI0039B92499
RPKREGGDKPRGERGERSDRPRDGKPQGKPPGKPGERPRREEERARSFESRPPRKDRIDPDNPFAAALMGLRDKI